MSWVTLTSGNLAWNWLISLSKAALSSARQWAKETSPVAAPVAGAPACLLPAVDPGPAQAPRAAVAPTPPSRASRERREMVVELVMSTSVGDDQGESGGSPLDDGNAEQVGSGTQLGPDISPGQNGVVREALVDEDMDEIAGVDVESDVGGVALEAVRCGHRLPRPEQQAQAGAALPGVVLGQAGQDDPAGLQREVAGDADLAVAVHRLGGLVGVGGQRCGGGAAVPQSDHVAFGIEIDGVDQVRRSGAERFHQQYGGCAVHVTLAHSRCALVGQPRQGAAGTDA